MLVKRPRWAVAILSLILLSSSFAVSAETKKKGSGTKTKVETTEKKSEEKIDGSRYLLNCSECHGFDGNSLSPEWPSIAGLNKKYITRQLKDFKSGKRKSEEMTLIVREFPSEKELDSLASYFSKQTMLNQNTPASIKNHEFVDLKIGEEIYTGKRFEYGIPACSACHGKDGMGDKDGKFPQLAGQHMDYIILQMEHFRSKERTNDTPAQMQNIAKVMDDEDIASVAAYIAYMRK